MHGVGHNFAAKAFDVFGFPPFIPVEHQKLPDPDFPTVTFPNPEEKGIIALLNGLSLIINFTGALVCETF